MGKITSWYEETESTETLPSGDAKHGGSMNSENKENPDEEPSFEMLPVYVREAESDNMADETDDAIEGEVEDPGVEGGTGEEIMAVSAQQPKSYTDVICQYVSELELISHSSYTGGTYDKTYHYYCDITEAAFNSIRALINSAERIEQLDYFRIMEEVLKVAYRQAAACSGNGEERRSPWLNRLISLIDEKASAQQQ